MKYYITTAVDYVNSKPHIGTATEKIGADVLARYHHKKGDQVFFLMGNDENTWKVAKRAKELGKDPKVYCDEMALQFKSVWNRLNIHPTRFIQTTEKDHIAGVHLFVEQVRHQLYKKNYSGMYCDGCEAFKTEKYCKDHINQPLRYVEEENWFFRLSNYRDKLLEIYDKNIIVIEPEHRKKEIVNLIADLEDISISRNNLGWGIPCAFDDAQVFYVWFDALLNYLTGIGFGTNWDKFYEWHPADVHIVGKDIVRWHTILFPAMLLAYNETAQKVIALPRKVFGHGFVSVNKAKVSKSGINIDPIELVDKFGTDAVRYYFMSRSDFGNDTEYDFNHFVEVYNADLADNLGNLVSRLTTMILRYCGGKIARQPAGKTEYYDKFMSKCHFREALLTIWSALSSLNEFIESNKPWELAKTDFPKCEQVLNVAVSSLLGAVDLIEPFMPDTAKAISSLLTTKDDECIVDQSKLVGGKVVPLFNKVKNE